jgi:hypothetical protein
VATLMAGSARLQDPSLDGRSVASVRSQYAGIHNIAPEAPAIVNGCRVQDETTAVLQASDELLFAKPSGTKGLSITV